MNNRPRHNAMRAGMLLAAAAAFICMLAGHAGTASAARNGRASAYLQLEVGLLYQKDMGRSATGARIDGEKMKETVRLTYGAYIVDPRLATYVTSLVLENEDSSGTFGEKSRLMAGSFNVSFFNRINRNRGAGLWRYVPSPLKLGVGHSESTYSVSTSYTLEAYYMLPGYIVLFDGNDWISYNQTGKLNYNNASSANRYRIKYSDESLNYNRNGNGNWNRNGNGNWNRNGNGNWNRNGNGNWNQNNANANGDGESNMGAGQGNGPDTDAAVRYRKPYVFRFPSLSLNMSRNEHEYKSDPGDKGYTQSGDLRADTSSTNTTDESYYASRYEMHYHWYETQWDRAIDQNTKQLDLEAENNWRRLRIKTRYEDYEQDVAGSVNERTTFDSTAYWRDEIDYFLYELNGGVGYGKYNDEEHKTASLQGLAELRYEKSRRISTKLRADTFARAQYSASRVQGERDYQADSWSLDMSETLISHHMEHIEARAAGRVEHTEFGTPLTASLSAVTQGLPRLRAFAEYSYSTVLSSDKDEEYQKNHFSANFRYFLTIFLDVSGSFVYENYSEVTGGALHSSSYGSYTETQGEVAWRPRAGLSFSGHTLMRSTEYEDYFENGVSGIKNLGRRSSLNASATIDTKSTVPGRHESYSMAYMFNRPKFEFTLEYQRDKWYEGWIENSIYMNIRRTFGRS